MPQVKCSICNGDMGWMSTNWSKYGAWVCVPCSLLPQWYRRSIRWLRRRNVMIGRVVAVCLVVFIAWWLLRRE